MKVKHILCITYLHVFMIIVGIRNEIEIEGYFLGWNIGIKKVFMKINIIAII